MDYWHQNSLWKAFWMSNKPCGGDSTKSISTKSRFLSHSHLSWELIPVYAIAITEKPYFDDNRAIHTFSMRDDENCEELKVKFKGIEEKRNLIRMVFLEIEKYRENTMENYKKIRWIEFFGNKPYTHESEKNNGTSR